MVAAVSPGILILVQECDVQTGVEWADAGAGQTHTLDRSGQRLAAGSIPEGSGEVALGGPVFREVWARGRGKGERGSGVGIKVGEEPVLQAGEPWGHG